MRDISERALPRTSGDCDQLLRRWLELKAAGSDPNEAALLKDIQERDARDKGRATAPLKPAPDAALLDTTHLDIDAAFAAALALVTPKIEALKARPRG